MAGRVTEKTERKRINGRIVEKVKEETEGGILHWGRESGPDLDWFRKEILEAYGGRAPRVLDPFAGGGAIPLEAMRLGCDVTAMDINPVAWFILKCTLEYPQKLAGKTRPLPAFAIEDRDLHGGFPQSQGPKGRPTEDSPPEVWPRRRRGCPDGRPASGRSSNGGGLGLARPGVGPVGAGTGASQVGCLSIPTYAEFIAPSPEWDGDRLDMRLLDLDDDGVAQLEPLNADFDTGYLKDPMKPPMGRQAHSSLPVGAHRRLQAVQGRRCHC